MIFTRPQINRATARRCGFATLVALPVLPILAYVVDGSPIVIFFTGALVFFCNVVLLCLLTAVCLKPPEGSEAVAARMRFTIRDLFCLTTFLAGIVVFMGSGFQCSGAEENSRPNPLPATELRRYVWEMESGLILVTLGGLAWLRRHTQSDANAGMS